MMVKVENKRTYKGDGVYIGRPSVLGNPFPVEQSLPAGDGPRHGRSFW